MKSVFEALRCSKALVQKVMNAMDAVALLSPLEDLGHCCTG